MELHEDDISSPYTTTLLSSQRITPSDSAEVRHLVLQLPEDDFAFREGQSIAVLVPGPHEFGNLYHMRLYSIASPRTGEEGKADTISICVRRCSYVDPVNGERYDGKASNYLCDATPGDQILITGPYGNHFTIPPDPSCNLLMIGAGTGIAPFRAFMARIYQERGGWKGKVRLFYGAKTGTELLYMNDLKKDLDLYYDEKTFQAFEAVSPRPHFDEEPALDRLLIDHTREIWEMIEDPKTYVYVAGLAGAAQQFEQAMITMAGGEHAWLHKRHELMAQQRYAELLHE
ncbi:MAG: FAD-binding oxidoreductase [Bryobacteraceae bacterium]